MGQLRLFLLGPPVIQLDGTPLVLPSAKVRALLFYLAVTGRPHDRSHLAGLLWGDLPEASARRNLRVALNKLRQPLAKYLSADFQSLALNPDAPCWLDVAAFQKAAGAVRKGPPTDGQERDLRTAVSHYRGEFLQGFQAQDAPEFEAWMTLEQERLRQMMLEVRHFLAGAAEMRGELVVAIEDVRAILAIDSWREEAHQQLMRLLAQSGRRSEALAQYEICCRILAEELAVEPSLATVALYKEIRAGGQHKQGTARTPHNLPAETTPFIGRQEELSQIAGLLADPGCRLLTLFGPGGIGKTRLALQAARQVVESFPDGVYLVALETIESVEPLVTSVAAALNIPLAGRMDPTSRLLAALRDRQMLLVLDNFEHLLAASDLLGALLREAPGLKLLITSREALNLYEEWLLAIEGLSYPAAVSAADPAVADPARFDAVTLFVQRARRVQLGFSLAGNEVDVAQICRLLGGMPLAIELAAAWVRTMHCAEIARQIAASLDLLTTSLRNVPDRHRSLAAVFDHSWNLLKPDEKQLLRRLSFFRGGFTAAAANQVAGARRELSVLVDKALLQVTTSGRYDIHPLIHRYAAGKLVAEVEEAAEVERRHMAYYAGMLADMETMITSRDQQQTLQLIVGDLDNIRTAWDTAVTKGHADYLSQMAGTLFHFYSKRGLHQEGFNRFDRAVVALRPQGTPSPLLAQLLVRQGRLGEYISHDPAVPQRLLTEGLALARQHELPAEMALALLGLGMQALTRGDNEQAGNHFAESLAICRQADIPWTMAGVLGLLAWLKSDTGEVEQAKMMCREAIAIHREAGDLIGVAAVLTTLGKVHTDLGEWAAAEAAYQEALIICEQNGHQVGLAQALTGLFNTCYWRGELDKAADYARQSVAANREVGDRLGMAIATHNLGFLAAGAGRHAEAAAHYRQALDIYQAINADRARRSNTHRYLAESLLALGEMTAAGEQLDEALHLLPEGASPQRTAELLLTSAAWLARRGEETLAAGIVACLQENGRLPTVIEPEVSALLAREPAVSFHSLDEGLAAVRQLFF